MRVRLCLNACVSCRMHESWQLWQLVKVYVHQGVYILSEVISLILTLTPTPSLLRFSDRLGAAQLSLT